MQERGIQLFEVEQGVAEVEDGILHLSDGTTVPFDECLWCTYASPAPWVAKTGLPLNAGTSLHSATQADLYLLPHNHNTQIDRCTTGCVQMASCW